MEGGGKGGGAERIGDLKSAHRVPHCNGPLIIVAYKK